MSRKLLCGQMKDNYPKSKFKKMRLEVLCKKKSLNPQISALEGESARVWHTVLQNLCPLGACLKSQNLNLNPEFFVLAFSQEMLRQS